MAEKEADACGETHSELEKFRCEWRAEIRQRWRGRDKIGNHSPVTTSDDGQSVEQEKSLDRNSQSKLQKAKELYAKAVMAEDNGSMSEALALYRQSYHLFPDLNDVVDQEDVDEEIYDTNTNQSDAEVEAECLDNEDLEDLIFHFENLGIRHGSICSANVPTKTTHMAHLPIEVMLYILKWVVSSEIDVCSLEQCSQVCRGLYLCCRDDDLWKKICQRVWGRAVSEDGPGIYKDFRTMYYQRPHLRFNGCYISKTEYLRQGERSLDNFYKPYHVVTYYRYARFFPDGTVLVMVTSDEPHEAVHRLRQRSSRLQGLLRGKFVMDENRITTVMKRVSTDFSQPYRYKRWSQEPEIDYSFFMDWELSNAGKRRNSLLKWKKYQLVTTYKKVPEITTADFEVQNNKNYPNMIFSRVKSYAVMSERPME